jgi:hypothetical protein
MMNGAMTSTSTAAQPGMPPSTLSLDYFMLLQTLGTFTFHFQNIFNKTGK